MDQLMLDVWTYISKFITIDSDKCRLMITCKEISRCNFYFENRILVDKISKLKWFNHFTYIEMMYGHTEFPASVTHLFFGNYYNYPIKIKIPLTVTYLIFSDSFNQPISGIIPSSVTYLYLGEYFDQPIKNCIPSSVKHLMINFNRPINNIPSTVTRLIFGYWFNQPIYDRSIVGNLPSTVTHLFFGERFNQAIKGQLPTSVKYLTFGKNFNLPLKKAIPSSVKEIIFRGKLSEERVQHIRKYCGHIDVFFPDI